MKDRILAAAVFILLAGLLVYFWWHPGSVKNSTASPDNISQDAAMTSALAKQDPKTVAIIESNFARVHPAQESLNPAGEGISPAPSGQPAPLQFTNFAPATVLENMSRAIRQYGTMFGSNPVGTNPEITSQLTGNNPRHINFLNAEAGMRVNENGELVDPWGTPYFFHQLSGTDMEIHSAGPDRIMWTTDDTVIK